MQLLCVNNSGGVGLLVACMTSLATDSAAVETGHSLLFFLFSLRTPLFSSFFFLFSFFFFLFQSFFPHRFNRPWRIR